MPRSFITRLAATAALAASLIPQLGAADIGGQPFIGFRNDGTGVFPPDCDPVTTWQEMRWDKGSYEHRGKKKNGLVPVERAPENIVWQKEMQMWCNGGMIVAGGKLFLMRDRGGVGFAFDHTPSFLGEELVCLDPADGKELWRADLHHVDLLPSDVQQEVETALREQVEYYPRVFGAHQRWYRACWQRSKAPAPPKAEHEKMYAEAAAEYRKYVPAVPATLEEQRANKKEWGASGYIQTMFWGIEDKYIPESGERQKLLDKYGYGTWNAWFGQGSFVGSAMATPVSDGEHIYMNTMHGDAFCYTLDGELVWKQWYGYDMTRGQAITSPILVDDLLIMRGQMAKKPGGKIEAHCWMAVDKKTGKIVWQTPKRGGRSYTDSSPTYHRLPIGGDQSQLLDVLWCPTGQVLRVADGKELATEIGCQGNGRPWAVHGNILAIKNGSSDGGRGEAQTWEKGLLAFRLQAASREEVTTELLWHNGDRDQPGRLTAKDGVLYGFEGRKAYAVDLLTGEQLSQVGFPRHAEKVHHLSAIAGNHLFGLSSVNDCLVVDLGSDGKQLSNAQVNRLGERMYHSYDFFNEGAQIFFSGNRTFIRSYSQLYCIGNPQAKMALSAAHR